jgi:hypothetical protein
MIVMIDTTSIPCTSHTYCQFITETNLQATFTFTDGSICTLKFYIYVLN